MTRKRTAERIEFLSDVLVTAVENMGYGWFSTEEWHCVEGDEENWFAEIRATDTAEEFRIDLDTVAKGFGVMTNRKIKFADKYSGEVPHNGKTGERMYISDASCKRILQASRENDACEIDVVDALAIIECALFGAVRYA